MLKNFYQVVRQRNYPLGVCKAQLAAVVTILMFVAFWRPYFSAAFPLFEHKSNLSLASYVTSAGLLAEVSAEVVDLGEAARKQEEPLQEESCSSESSRVVETRDISKFDILFRGKTAVEILKQEQSIKAGEVVLKKPDGVEVLPDVFTFMRKKIFEQDRGRVSFLKSRNPERELQLALYRKEVIKHLRVALRSAANAAPVNIAEFCKRFVDRITYYLVINKDGFIKNLFLTSLTGTEAIDTFLVDAVRTAVPFPPIPSHLKLDQFVVFE